LKFLKKYYIIYKEEMYRFNMKEDWRFFSISSVERRSK